MAQAKRWLLNTPVNLGLTLLLLLVACGSPGAPKAPNSPTNVTATSGPGYITVQWQDASDDETGFEIYRKPVAGATAQQAGAEAGTKVGTVGADETSYVDMDVELEQEYAYSVMAVNEVGPSGAAPAASGAGVPVGVDLMVGTNNRRWSEDTNGTIFAVYFVLPEAMLDDQADVFNVSITGPAGWNDDNDLTFNCYWNECDRALGFAIYSGNEITAVAGEYTVNVLAGGETYTATATLTDPSFKFARPTEMSVSNASASGATLEWTAPPGALSSWITLYHDEYGAYVDAWGVGLEDTLTVDGLTLADGIYGFEIAAFNADIITYPIKTEPFGLSYDYRMFGVGDVYSPECSSAAQVVTIPDAALLQAIRGELDIPTGDITCMDMALLVSISAEDAGIASLEGLQFAPNLADVFLHGNEVSDLTPLADLTEIWHLNLNVNEITEVGPLENLTKLRELHLCCTTDNITDVTPLEGLTQIEGLNLAGHELGDALLWPLLENYPNLRGLWVGDNDLTDFSALTNHPQLEELEIHSHVINDLTPVASLNNLRELYIQWSDIDDLTPIHSMTQLERLDLGSLEITDISFLEDFVNLSWLLLGDNQITSLAPLVANSGIGAGDFIDVRSNLLDLGDVSVQADIQTLLDRGVDLQYE